MWIRVARQSVQILANQVAGAKVVRTFVVLLVLCTEEMGPELVNQRRIRSPSV